MGEFERSARVKKARADYMYVMDGPLVCHRLKMRCEDGNRSRSGEWGEWGHPKLSKAIGCEWGEVCQANNTI